MSKARRYPSQAMLAKKMRDTSDTAASRLTSTVQEDPRNSNLDSCEEVLAPALDWPCQLHS